jgi:hypothetical protein
MPAFEAFAAPPEWQHEAASEMADEPGETMTGYQYRGSGRSLSPAEAAEAARNGARPSPALSAAATSRPSALAAAPAPPPTLKGAVKVEGFPTRSPYPFREIADDGGVWQLDPAAFLWRGKPTKDTSIRTAASKWAIERGMTAKTVIDGGYLYLQFVRGTP